MSEQRRSGTRGQNLKVLAAQNQEQKRNVLLRMEPELNHVLPDDPVIDVFARMERLGVHQLPLRDRDHRVVGMVFRRHPLVPGAELVQPPKQDSAHLSLRTA